MSKTSSNTYRRNSVVWKLIEVVDKESVISAFPKVKENFNLKESLDDHVAAFNYRQIQMQESVIKKRIHHILVIKPSRNERGTNYHSCSYYDRKHLKRLSKKV